VEPTSFVRVIKALSTLKERLRSYGEKEEKNKMFENNYGIV